MKITILGMNKIKFKCEKDKVAAVGYMSLGLIEAGRVVESIASNFPFQKPTGALSTAYTYTQEAPDTLALYSSVFYWKYVEYGTGIYSLLNGGRSTPWKYTVESGPWAGSRWTYGQKPKLMLTNAVQANKKLLAEVVRNRILSGLIYGH